MKRYLASVASAVILLFAFGLAPAGAQDQPPAPYNTQQPPAPYNNGQGAPPRYNNQGAPPPYNNQNSQGAPDQSANGATDGSTDGPQPGEARASIVQGDVSSQRGDNGDWVALTQNAPISPGDRVATGNNARAELQLDAADVLRMSANTTANIVTLNRNGLQVQVGQGLANFTVIRGSDANPEIDTPNVAIHPTGAGEFRIQVTSDTETKITIRSGSADISTPQGSTHVEAGQLITVQGTDNPQYRTDAAPNADAFDTWNDERDRHIVSAQSWHKTDPYYTGSEDLDTYGVWSEVPDYGQVWTPSNPIQLGALSRRAGFGLPTTDGRGFRASLGVGRRITTDDGSSTADAGHGGPGPSWPTQPTIRCGRPHTCPSSDGEAAASESEWDLVSDSVALAGFQLGLAIGITRGGAVGATATGRSV